MDEVKNLFQQVDKRSHWCGNETARLPRSSPIVAKSSKKIKITEDRDIARKLKKTLQNCKKITAERIIASENLTLSVR